jgi:hypothetical protein
MNNHRRLVYVMSLSVFSQKIHINILMHSVLGYMKQISKEQYYWIKAAFTCPFLCLSASKRLYSGLMPRQSCGKSAGFTQVPPKAARNTLLFAQLQRTAPPACC